MQILKSVSKSFVVATRWLSLVCAFGTFPVFAQVGQTVNWAGGNSFASYSDTNNWSPKVVPVNNGGTNFTVIVPDSANLTLDIGGPGAIDALALRVGSFLDILVSNRLTVNGVALVRGTVQVTGAGSGFSAMGSQTVMEANPQLWAYQGGQIGLSASTYSWDKYNGNATLIYAADPGSSITLTNLSSMSLSYGDYGAWTYLIGADNGGLVDLRNLGQVSGPGSDDWLEFRLNSGADIRLDKVQQSSGNVRFQVNSASYSLPSLNRASATQFNVATNNILSVPSLIAVDNATISVADNALFTATNLLSLDNVVVNLTGTGTFMATNLAAFRNSDIAMWPGKSLFIGLLTDINSSRLAVTSGGLLRVAAASYNTPSSWQWYGTLFSADGAGSLLDLSTVAAMTTHYCNWGGYGYRYMVNANNNGVIDLSGLTTLTGPEYSDRLLEFNIGNGGNILLGNLRQILGYTRFNINVPTFSMPGLQSVATTTFSVGAGDTLSLPQAQTLSSCAISLGDGARMDLPQLQSYTSGSVTWGFNGTLNTPGLTDVSLSSISWQPGQNLIAPPFTTIYGAQLLVSGGETGRVAATSYNTPSSWQWYGTLFSADGAGSLLDLSTVAAMTTHYCNWGGYGYRYMVNANNNGVIDLSGLTTLTGPEYSDRLLEFNIGNGGNILLGNLRQILGYTRFNINVPTFSMPGLQSVATTTFSVGASDTLSLPKAQALSSCAINLGDGARMDLPQLQSYTSGSVTWGFNGTLNTPMLTDVSLSSISWQPGQNLIAPLFTNIYGAQLLVNGGDTGRVAAVSYNTPSSWQWYGTLFSADGAGSLLDLSTVAAMTTHYCNWGGYGYRYMVNANNNGVIDLSGLTTLTGPEYSDRLLEFNVSNGGAARFGNVSLYSYLTLNASGTSSLLEFEGIYARSTVKIGVNAKAIIDSKGDFLYENTDPNSIVIEGAYFQMDGARPQRLEVGGRDLGAGGASSRNFGYSQLIVGSTNQSSVVNLVDTLNNGNRGAGGTPEALYLYGQDGAGLSLYNGSRLALNGINCYAFVNGQMKRLNDLIPAGTNSVAFDGGFLVNDGGPRITNMTPSVAVTPIVSSVTVSFDQPIDPASFTASDVSISGPSGAVAATGVTLVSNTTWMVSFQPQSTDGTYAVKVGPNIDELAGNIHGLDQNGDGLAGDGTNDVFMGTFVIDGTAPLLVSAYGLQFGNRIGVTFNEPLVATFATNPANYAIDGQAASNAVLQADRSLVALSVTPAAGSVFSLSVTGVTDLLGNVTNRLLDGTILPLQPMDIGISGDSREAGWSVPWSSTNFDIVAGGYAISSSSDSFHFLSEQRTGDFDVQVRLDSYKGTGGGAGGDHVP